MYKVQFLNDSEFESLKYDDMANSMGVADPETQTAYVRRTGVNVLDAMNMVHELDHLKDGDEGQFAHHKSNGVYYKKFNEMLQQIVPMLANFIPGIGPAVGATMGATNSFGAFGKSPGQVQQANQQRDAQGAQQGQGMAMAQQPMGQGAPATSGQAPGGQGGGANVGGAMNKALNAIRQQQGNGGNFSGGQSNPFAQMSYGREQGRF